MIKVFPSTVIISIMIIILFYSGNAYKFRNKCKSIQKVIGDPATMM